MQPPVQFATTSDGVRIAYCCHGEGPPLVFVRGWLSHLEWMWDAPAFRAYFQALAQHFRLVRYDGRGNGLSDRDVTALDLDSLVLDLDAVIDALGLRDVTLYASCYGGPIAIAYTVNHPDRVTRLIIEGSFARGEAIAPPERQRDFIYMVRNWWPAGAGVVDHLTRPDTSETKLGDLIRGRPTPLSGSASPQVAAELYSTAFRIDITDLLPHVHVPTLVLHPRNSQAIPFELGRQLAAQIPGARFVAVESSAHNLWEGDVRAALAAIGDFVGVNIEYEAPATAGTAATSAVSVVLFTDLEGSTILTDRLGDEAAQQLVRAHNVAVRGALRAHGGTEIKHTGDGIMASFPAASAALDCAIAAQRAFAPHARAAPMPGRMRVGINAGEPLAEEGDLFGTAVQVARRICDAAEPGQILVSDVVRQLVAGKQYLFASRGETPLRGFEDPVRLFELRWKQG
jgi:class 3 adenylate cyclase